MFDLLGRTARALVDVTADCLDIMEGGGGPSRGDVATLVEAGMTVASIAVTLGVAEDAVLAMLPDEEA